PVQPRRGPARAPAATAARPVGLRVARTRSLPAPVQLPGVARAGAGVLAVAGLSTADVSVADVVRLAPGAPRRVGALPRPVHDVATATLAGRLYVFGGGSAAGPTDAITRVAAGGRVSAAGHLPVALSDA